MTFANKAVLVRVALSSILITLFSFAANPTPSTVSARSTTSPNVGTSTLFAEYKKVIASDGADLDRFGETTSISGKTAVIGASYDDARRGAAYVFERNRDGADSWGEVRKIVANDGVAQDRFGFALDISGDTIVVASPSDDALRGSVYIFARNTGGGDNWGQLKKILAPDGTTGDQFGSSVGISGDSIIVGAPIDDAGRGSAYVFERNQGGANNWGLVKKLQSTDGTNDDFFGSAVALSNDTVVAGAYGDDSHKGSAYVFERNNGGADNWGQVRKIVASDGVASDQFGGTVEIDFDTVIVGSIVNDSYRGAVYVYGRNKNGVDSWGEVKKVVANDAQKLDLFSQFLSISNDMIVVGTSFIDSSKGAVFVYERNRGGAENWGQVARLTASDRATGDAFGSASICGNTIVIGARSSYEGMGSAYVFLGLNKEWVQERKTVASDGVADDRYGVSTSISGKTAVIGANFDDARRGSAYVLERNKGGADSWGEVRRLTASDGVAADTFGSSVHISGDTVIAGAPADDARRGSVYVFERNKGGGDNWGEVKKLTASDGAAQDQFGTSVGISGDTIVVSAPDDDEGKGAAYVFERNKGGVNNWGEVRKLTASGALSAELFGASVAISTDTVVVGAPGDDLTKGSAFIFERNKGGVDNWGEVRKLTTLDGIVGDSLGAAVDIAGDTVVVSAPLDDAQKGSAYIFLRNAGGTDNWGQLRKLVAADGLAGNLLGQFLTLDNDTVAIGARSVSADRGAVYVFERNQDGADSWGQMQKLTSGDGAPGDLFGIAALSGNSLIVGARGDDVSKGSAYIFSTVPEAVSVCAASFQRTALAPQMIAAAFGQDLATGVEVGGTIPLPTSLGGTTVAVRDSVGVERLAQLFFVSPAQINYYVPQGTALGSATVKVTSGTGQVSFGVVEIANVGPGIFSANTDGVGVSAAQILRIRGTQLVYESVTTYDAGSGKYVPQPIDLGPVTDDVYLILYGTGFRFRSSGSAVSLKVAGRILPALFAGAVDRFIGLDQLNSSKLPRDLIAAGVVNVEVTIDGKAANTTTVAFK